MRVQGSVQVLCPGFGHVEETDDLTFVPNGAQPDVFEGDTPGRLFGQQRCRSNRWDPVRLHELDSNEEKPGDRPSSGFRFCPRAHPPSDPSYGGYAGGRCPRDG